jgi:NADH-quinone oxidoreductase subunit F
VGANIFDSGFSLDMVVHPGAGAYICGEETALLESLGGKARLPAHQAPVLPGRHRPLRRAHRGQQRGDDGQHPLDHRTTAAPPSPRWVRAARPGRGCSRWPGTCSNPGVYELEMVKNTFRDLIYAPVLGGGIRAGTSSRPSSPAASPRRGSGPDQVDLPLGQDEVGKAGSMLGSGSIVVMDSDTCVVRAAWRITKFFSRESCGQCTPCREGSGWLERIMYRIENGAGREEDLDLLMDLCDNISPGVAWPPQQTTICVLGPSIPSSIASGIRMFRDEFLVHVKEGGCPFD